MFDFFENYLVSFEHVLKNLTFLQYLPLYLFACGLCGVFIGRKNLVLVVISLELLILAVTFHFLFISWGVFGDLKGIVFAMFSLCIGAAESALGLAFAISYLRSLKSSS